MSRNINILISSAGRRVSLTKYFKQEAKKYLGEEANVFTTDLNPQMSAACLLSDKGFKVGRFADEDYIAQFLKLCKENSVKLVVPTLDPELLLLSNARKQFHAEGIELLVSDSPFVSICRDKRKMNIFFREKGFLVPKKIDRNNPTFPLFIKPIDGSSSQDLYFIKDKSMLSEYHVQNEKLMFMEYLDKKRFKEYTIDLYYDKNSQLKCVVPRVRLAVRGGETNKGITQKNELVEFVREKLGTIDGARGCLTLQVFQDMESTDVYGIEINPRFGGGYPLSYLAGANFPAWIIQEYLNGEEIPWFEDWEDQLLLLRYDQEMIIHDFDY